MKQPQESTSLSNPKKDRGSIIGFCVLGSLVVFVAVWLQVQANKASSQSSAVASAANKELTRFRADAWYLAAEPLLGFVEIPAGQFVMGSDPQTDPMAFENERWSEQLKQGKVEIPVFYISRYEVTVAQFQAFVLASGVKTAQAPAGIPDHPVANVSWTDALAYSRWLQAQLLQSPQTPDTILNLLRDGWQITLPNEAQWEKAARGADGRIFPWGNVLSREHANFRGTSTAPVGSFPCPECAFNLADMSGNVWELTRSAYQPYPFDPKRAPDLHADALFVMRGGSFNDVENNIRTAVRGGIDPGVRRPFIGFRIVLARD